MSDLPSLLAYTRLADYLSAAQIYLRDNFFLEKSLKVEHIKPRLLGHWGTSPGINFVFAHVNRLITRTPERRFLFIIGPGHGFPAYQAGLFIEGTLSHFYPDKIPFTIDGIKEFVSHFSTPYGYPSHVNPEAPGAILEGGELGYSLATAAGSVLDEPELVTVCLVGDGEAETGPLAAAWNVNRFIRPGKDGAVLPILHLNGYKISGPTVFGRMTDKEIHDFFSAHGYEPFFIEGKDNPERHRVAMRVFDTAIKRIIHLQTQGFKKESSISPRWPLIVLKTPKGMGAPAIVDGEKVEGNAAAHQVIFKDLTTNARHLKLLEKWLKSYRIDELIFVDAKGKLRLSQDIEDLLPSKERRVGRACDAHRGQEIFHIASGRSVLKSQLGRAEKDAARAVGEYLAELYAINPRTFRLFSPDETYSNHLDAVFSQTSRAWLWPIKKWDKDLSARGRVVELLSEHTLFGMLMGYTLTGRTGVFASYEAFAHIVSSMIDQYVKFLKVARHVHFRRPVAPLNVLLSSLLERQDHNGFSHQNPSFIANLLDHDSDIVRVYFPPDRNCAVTAFQEGLLRRNGVNVFVVGKQQKDIYFSPRAARAHVSRGASIMKRFSDAHPDIVLVSTGDYVTNSTVAALPLIRRYMPQVRIRLVNVMHFSALEEGSDEEKRYFADNLFTPDKPVLWYYHGYPTSIKKILFGVVSSRRVSVHGYHERGSTTTPFDMRARNEESRFHIVKHVAEAAARQHLIPVSQKDKIEEKMDTLLERERAYIIEHGIDPADINSWAYEKE